MKFRPILFLVCDLFLMVLAVGSARACTWFEFSNDKKNCFIGRTMEWPGDLQGQISLVPRNYQMGEFKTQYGFVGISHGGKFSDGINEHGLAVSALWLDESKYSDKTEDALNIMELLPRVLGSTKTVEEAVEFVKANKFYTSSSEVTPGLDLKLHFAVTEASGRSVVIEFINGETRIHENRVGAMTNDPSYEEQLKIWSAYDPSKFNEETFEGFNYSPTGRFCRMAAFNATQAGVPDDLAAVNRAWSMVNTVDIPQGILYWRWVSDQPQFTSYSVVADLHNRVYYFRTYNNYDIRKLDLNTINFATAQYRSVPLFTPAHYQEFLFE